MDEVIVQPSVPAVVPGADIVWLGDDVGYGTRCRLCILKGI
jgi:hypothetical protein